MSLTTGLLSYYKFDESSGNAADSVGSRTWTNVNSISYGSAIINNGADAGTNTNKRFTGTNILTADQLASAWSWGFWIYYNNLPASGGSYRVVENTGAVTGSSKRLIWLDRYTNTAGQYIQIANIGTSVQIFGSNISVSTGVWYYHLWTYDGTNARLYIDGATTPNWTQAISFTVRGDGVGNDTAALMAGITGGEESSVRLDEMGIWSRTLAGSDSADLYNGGAGLTYPFISPTNNAGFMAWYN